MKVTHGVKKKIKEQKKLFEKRQKEAFQQFMKAHFANPLCQDTLMHSLSKS
jgi:hypothetical protein